MQWFATCAALCVWKGKGQANIAKTFTELKIWPDMI
jgi:hypothetical protein